MATSSSLQFRQLLTSHDLQDSSKLPGLIDTFNRRLTKRMASCQLQIICCDGDNGVATSLRGGVKVKVSIAARPTPYITNSSPSLGKLQD